MEVVILDGGFKRNKKVIYIFFNKELNKTIEQNRIEQYQQLMMSVSNHFIGKGKKCLFCALNR